MARTKTYGHYCAAARALEVVGEKWSLLVVRDLLWGPLRFSDLMRSLGGITPKLLTLRLRELESAGIVERDEEPGRREVWYRLTPAGLALRPVIQELLVWGLDYAPPPAPGEWVDPRRAAGATVAALNRRHLKPRGATTWALRFDGDPPPSIRYDGERWSLVREEATAADLTIEASPTAWLDLIRAKPDGRAEALRQVRLVGDPEQADEFARLFRD